MVGEAKEIGGSHELRLPFIPLANGCTGQVLVSEGCFSPHRAPSQRFPVMQPPGLVGMGGTGTHPTRTVSTLATSSAISEVDFREVAGLVDEPHSSNISTNKTHNSLRAVLQPAVALFRHSGLINSYTPPPQTCRLPPISVAMTSRLSNTPGSRVGLSVPSLRDLVLPSVITTRADVALFSMTYRTWI